MAVNFIRAHRHRIILGAPVVFLFLVSGGGVDTSTNGYEFAISGSPFVHVGDTREITVLADTKFAVNAVGGTLRFSHDLAIVEHTSIANSIVEIWAEPPGISSVEGFSHFSGGFAREGGYVGRGEIFSVRFRAIKSGVLTLTIDDAELLASNGLGTNIARSTIPTLRLYFHDDSRPSPDINEDGKISLADASLLYLESFRTYNPRYDLNVDGKINWGDVRYLISIMGE